MAFLSVPMCFDEQHHTEPGTPFLLVAAWLHDGGKGLRLGLSVFISVNQR